jgi:hypothetical protein
VEAAKAKAAAMGGAPAPAAAPAAAPTPAAAAPAPAAPAPAAAAPAPAAAAPSPPPPPPAGAAPRADGRVIATPYAKQLAKDLKVDLSKIGGSGPSGRITASDVERAAGKGEPRPPEASRSSSCCNPARRFGWPRNCDAEHVDSCEPSQARCCAGRGPEGRSTAPRLCAGSRITFASGADAFPSPASCAGRAGQAPGQLPRRCCCAALTRRPLPPPQRPPRLPPRLQLPPPRLPGPPPRPPCPPPPPAPPPCPSCAAPPSPSPACRSQSPRT